MSSYKSLDLFGSGPHRFAAEFQGSLVVPKLRLGDAASGSGWLGLKDRQAYLTRGVKLTPMFNGFAALAALLALIALAWWREGR